GRDSITAAGRACAVHRHIARCAASALTLARAISERFCAHRARLFHRLAAGFNTRLSRADQSFPDSDVAAFGRTVSDLRRTLLDRLGHETQSTDLQRRCRAWRALFRR